MAKREIVILLATLVILAECNRMPRNSLNKSPQNVNNNKPHQIGADNIANEPQGLKAAGNKIESPKMAYKESPESSSESDEISLFSSAAGLLSGVLNTGRRNLDSLKSVPVVGNVVPMMNPLINGVSKIVQRSVDSANEANLLELGDLYNRTNEMVKILKKQYNTLSLTEEDNQNLETYVESVHNYFNFQHVRYTYKTNSSAVGFSEALNELIKRRNYTAVQFSAPVLKGASVTQSVLSLPVEIVQTVCRIDTPDDVCIKNVVRLTEVTNMGQCGSGDQIKFKIFKVALENIHVEGPKIEEVKQNIVSKVKAKISAVRRKRNSHLAANNVQSKKPAVLNEKIKTASVEVQRIRRNIAGNVPIGLSNDNAVNTGTKLLANNNAKPNLTPNQVQNNAKPNIATNQVINNVGSVPSIPAPSTNNLASQNSESRRMNNNLGTNQAQIVPGVSATDNIVNNNLGSRRMNNVGVSEQPIDVRKAGNIPANTNIGLTNAAGQAPVSNPAVPSRRSNTEELITHTEIFDLIVAELKDLYNIGKLDGRCKMFEAIANAQKEDTLCNDLLLDKVLDFTPLL